MSILTAVTKEACDIVDAELEGRLAEDGVAVVSSQLAPVGPSLSIGKFGRRVCNDRAYRLHLGRRRGAVKGVANEYRLVLRFPSACMTCLFSDQINEPSSRAACLRKESSAFALSGDASIRSPRFLSPAGNHLR